MFQICLIVFFVWRQLRSSHECQNTETACTAMYSGVPNSVCTYHGIMAPVKPGGNRKTEGNKKNMRARNRKIKETKGARQGGARKSQVEPAALQLCDPAAPEPNSKQPSQRKQPLTHRPCRSKPPLPPSSPPPARWAQGP